MVRARKRKRRLKLATIGTLKKTGSNEFTGENAPSHRILVGRAEIGGAWPKRSNEGRDYLGLKLDHTSFNAPIYANLFDDEEGDTFSLIWSRPNGCRGTKAPTARSGPFLCPRETRCAHRNRYTQFSTRTPGMRMNSFMLFVTTISPSLRACAPICMSCGPQGVPAPSSSART